MIYILIILLVIAVLVYTLLKLVRKHEYDIERKDFKEFAQKYEEMIVLPRNIYELYAYKGQYERDYLYKNMKTFIDYMDYLNQNVDIDEIEDFYHEQAKEIKDILGIEEISKFQEFVHTLKNKNIQTSSLSYAEIVKNSSVSKDGYFEFDMYLYYGQENTPISIHVRLANTKSNPIDVLYAFNK